MLVIVASVICCVCILEWFLNCRRRAKAFWSIPGPEGAIIFGSCLQVVGTPVQLFRNLRKWASMHEDIYRQWIYPYGVVHIYNPHDIEVVISNPKYNEKSLLYDNLRPWLCDGLLLSKGYKWQMRRKILTPAFHFNILRHFTAILEENSSRLVTKLEDELNHERSDVIPLMSDTTLNSICETSMGAKLDEDSSGAGKLYKSAIHEIGKLIIHRIARSWLAFDTIFNLTKEGRRQKEVLNVIHNFPKRIIEDRRIFIEKHGFKVPTDDLDEEDVVGPIKRRMAMLDLLLSAEKEGMIDDDGIQEEVDTFMFEGHDTTAMGLTFILMELANNPSVQDKVVQELREIFGQSSRPGSMQDMSQMKYLECCIKEALRLYPPVPFISRYITDTVTLSGHVIPRGKTLCHIHIFDLHRRADLYPEPLVFNPERFTAGNCASRHPYAYIPFSGGPRNCIGLLVVLAVCHIHIFDLHRRADMYPEPLVFNPERFTAGNCASRHPYAYIPFSGGPRNCIGQRFAMLEMKSAVSAVLRRYRLLPFTTPDQLQFSADLVLRTTHPVYVRFQRRQH